MNYPEDIFPDHILMVAPLPFPMVNVPEYLNYLADDRPDVLTAALSYADHDDLGGLLVLRHWSRGRVTDMQALADIAEHPQTDFWIALAVLLRLYPDEASAGAIKSLALRLVESINADALPMRYSSTPIISTRGLELYALIVEGQPELAISDEMAAKAVAHATWLERKRPADARFALFNGGPMWAANRGDGE